MQKPAAKNTAAKDFTAVAGGGLAPVAGQIAGVHQAAKTGAVKLTEDAAKKLVDSLDHARATLAQLIKESAQLEKPLPLGDNFIGRAMSDRLQEVATEGTGAAIPVLQEFAKVLTDLELAVKSARHLYTAKDEKAREDLDRIMGQFGMEDGGTA